MGGIRSIGMKSADASRGEALRQGAERGVTLLELMIYLVVVAILGVPILMITLSVSRASAEGDMLSKILERNRSCLQRIATEYREALKGTTVLGTDTKSIQFTSTAGFDGAGPITGPVVRYEIRLAPGESANGADDNHNLLADEGVVVRSENGNEVVIASAVDMVASSFIPTGTANGVTITLVTFGRTKDASTATEANRTLTVYPRN